MLLGYDRVSTDDRGLAAQRAASLAVGCKNVYDKTVSRAERDRAELARLLDQLRGGDALVITRLATRQTIVAEPCADFTSSAGRRVLAVFAWVAEFERAPLQQRISAGRALPNNEKCELDACRTWVPSNPPSPVS